MYTNRCIVTQTDTHTHSTQWHTYVCTCTHICTHMHMCTSHTCMHAHTRTCNTVACVYTEGKLKNIWVFFFNFHLLYFSLQRRVWMLLFCSLCTRRDLFSVHLMENWSWRCSLPAAVATGHSVSAKPAKIVAGHEPEKTNEFLQALAAAINANVSTCYLRLML